LGGEASYGFYVNGNDANTEATTVSIHGPDRVIVFQTKSSGNASVQLPDDAIEADEILDEVGVVSAGYAGQAAPPVFGDYWSMRQVDITAPAAGYALVIGTCEVRLQHAGLLGGSSVTLGVSTSSGSIPTNQHVTFKPPPEIGNVVYQVPMTVHGVFPVSEGTNTFHLVGLISTHFTDDTWVGEVQLSVIYIPTDYGDIYPYEYPAARTTTEGGDADEIEAARGPLTQADIEAERTASIAANQARIDRELAEMRAEMEKLRREMEEGQR
jgi:hypothetical protein